MFFPQDKVAILIKIAASKFDKLANAVLGKYDLTASQFKVMKYLYFNQDRPVRMTDIEKHFLMTHATTIGLLNQLERKKFIVRKVNEQDKRSNSIEIVPEMLSKKDEFIAIGNQLESRMTKALSEDEQQQLKHLLKKLLSGVQDL
ncbi:MarR family winged helix-turn-helix transcriptional regulator [Succinivibrio dextrinosolvens]|uniref:MarR family winged helix-turn-helix transcriptional regulator n=1 Tax=Succinivibrio dextrinosolvens TaxID=83771 RepID=UPI0024203879|nr:MarR family transcriptional regulator [Succinivibrio dextrinosolvens]